MISQTLTNLLVGVTYQVTGSFFDVYSQYGGSSPDSFGAYVTAPDGNHQDTLGHVTAAKTPLGLRSFSFTFTATGTVATLSLYGEQNDVGASFGVDNLVLRAQNAPSYLSDFGASSVNLYIDNAGRETATVTNKPSLFPVYDTALVPFVRTADITNTTYGGSDSLTIISTGSTHDLNATLSTYQVPVDNLVAGKPVLYGAGLPNYNQSPTAETYFGGEAVLDPFTGQQLTYTCDSNAPDDASNPCVVRDLFSRDIVYDPFQVPLLHHDGDPMFHIAGDPIVHQRGDDTLYLGGEPVFDENGNQVFTGSDPFLHSADQGEIQDRRTTVYYLVQANGSAVPINAAIFNVPSITLPTGISMSTTLHVGDFVSGYTVKTGDQFSLTIYDGTKIYDIAVTVDADGTIHLTGLASTISHSVKVALVIATPAMHASSSGEQYYGDEAALAGQPVVDGSGQPERDSSGNVILYTSTLLSATIAETETHDFTGTGQKISLLAPPLAGHAVTVIVGSTNAWRGRLLVLILTISKTGLTVGATVTIGYTAAFATETKNESYFYEGTGQSIVLGSTPVTGQSVVLTIGGVLMTEGTDFTISGQTLHVLRNSPTLGRRHARDHLHRARAAQPRGGRPRRQPADAGHLRPGDLRGR